MRTRQSLDPDLIVTNATLLYKPRKKKKVVTEIDIITNQCLQFISEVSYIFLLLTTLLFNIS